MDQLTAMALSIAVEAGVAAGGASLLGLRPRRSALAAGLGTLLTHPLAWNAMLAAYAHAPVWLCILGVECVVVATESGLYRRIARLTWGQALGASLVANASSTAVGLISWWL